MKKSTLAGLLATAALACAGTAQAAAVTIAQSMALAEPSGGLVYNIATNSNGTPTTKYYEIVVDSSWTEPTKFTTFSAEPLGSSATYQLWTDTNSNVSSVANGSQGTTGTLLTSWTLNDIVGTNSVPFFSYLLTAGQYVLGISTSPGQLSVSTSISAVPLPGALWLFGTALAAFLGISRRRKL